MAAFWGRPHAYFDPETRKATSPWRDLPTDIVNRALDQLRRDLDSGEWQTRYGHLAALPELDVGLRLITARILSAGGVVREAAHGSSLIVRRSS